MRSILYLVSSLAGAALAQTPLNTSEVSLISSNYGGSGCPTGSVSTSFSPDRKTITLSFDSINLYLGPNTTPRLDAVKNCAVHLRLQYPAGWRFIIEDVTWHGFFTIPSDVRALFYTTFEILSVDLQTVTVPTLQINGSDTTRGDIVTEKVGAINVLPSACYGSGSTSNITDTIVAHDRWGLTALKNGVVVQDWMGDEGGRVPLVQQIGLRWVACR
ncbi:protein of unknown function (DUF4360) domain containing protein [Naviculisporaceae sp. PSN 640]